MGIRVGKTSQVFSRNLCIYDQSCRSSFRLQTHVTEFFRVPIASAGDAWGVGGWGVQPTRLYLQGTVSQSPDPQHRVHSDSWNFTTGTCSFGFLALISPKGRVITLEEATCLSCHRRLSCVLAESKKRSVLGIRRGH